jgi:hypothetical protein
MRRNHLLSLLLGVLTVLGCLVPAAQVQAADGDELWTRQFGTSLQDQGMGVAVDGSGVYVTGYTSGALEGTSAGGWDVFLRKYDAAGTEQWTRQFGTLSEDRGYGVAVDGSGVYVTGYTSGALEGTSAGGRDVFVRKYDVAGTELWTRQFGTPNDDEGYGVAVDGSGVYVTGYTEGDLKGISAGGRDVFLRKYDTAGNELWTDQFGTSGYDYGQGVTVDGSGVYVAGRTDIDGALPGQTSAGARDVFVRKYDEVGTAQWTRQFGTPNDDEGYGVATGGSGVYVTGYTYGALWGASAGGTDVFVRRYDTLTLVPGVAPVVDAGSDMTVVEGQAWSGSGSFVDDDSTSWSATVDWGDGGAAESLTLAGKTFSLAHTWATSGSYTVTVTVTDDGAGSGSDTFQVTVGDATLPVLPGAPSVVRSTPGSRTVRVSWLAPSDGGAVISDYVIQYRRHGNTSWNLFRDGVSADTHTHVGGLSNGVVYQFRVAAQNNVGVGPWSTTTEMRAGVPTEPQSVVPTARSRQVQLSWQLPVSTSGAPITDYVIQYRRHGNTSWTTFLDAWSTSRHTHVMGLTNGINYQFRVAARNARGIGVWSAVVEAQPRS